MEEVGSKQCKLLGKLHVHDKKLLVADKQYQMDGVADSWDDNLIWHLGKVT